MIRKTEHTREVIVMDVDGVVADFIFSMTQITKQLFGKPEYPVGTFQAEAWGVEWLGLTKVDEDKFWEHIRTSSEPFWENEREIVPGLISKISYLVEDSTFYFCTTRDDCASGSAQAQTRRFLETNGFFKPNVVVSDKKGDFCYSVNANYFIDDKFSNCKEVIQKSPKTLVYFLMLNSQKEFKEEAESLGMCVVTSVATFLDELYHAGVIGEKD